MLRMFCSDQFMFGEGQRLAADGAVADGALLHHHHILAGCIVKLLLQDKSQ